MLGGAVAAWPPERAFVRLPAVRFPPPEEPVLREARARVLAPQCAPKRVAGPGPPCRPQMRRNSTRAQARLRPNRCGAQPAAAVPAFARSESRACLPGAATLAFPHRWMSPETGSRQKMLEKIGLGAAPHPTSLARAVWAAVSEGGYVRPQRADRSLVGRVRAGLSRPRLGPGLGPRETAPAVLRLDRLRADDPGAHGHRIVHSS